MAERIVSRRTQIFLHRGEGAQRLRPQFLVVQNLPCAQARKSDPRRPMAPKDWILRFGFAKVRPVPFRRVPAAPFITKCLERSRPKPALLRGRIQLSQSPSNPGRAMREPGQVSCDPGGLPT